MYPSTMCTAPYQVCTRLRLMQRPKSKGPRRGVSSAPPVPVGLEKMSIVGSNRRANPSSRPNIGGADTHRSEGSLRSQASSSFQRQQEALGGGSSGHHAVIAALQSCVKVFCTAVAPSYMLPWMRGEESHRVGSAFAAILPSGERRLFTHAQVVENCTLVQVRRAVDAQKFVARVVHVGFDVDIAVLHVDDPSFWEAIPALPLPTALPGIMTEVMVVGFGMGGDELSTTRGVVNRITLGGTTRELCLQIDATFNPGNAGGPVLGPDGSLIGMSASNSAQAQNEGYIIPMPVMHTFLQNVANAARDGLPYQVVRVGVRRPTLALALAPTPTLTLSSRSPNPSPSPYQGRATDCFRLQPLRETINI